MKSTKPKYDRRSIDHQIKSAQGMIKAHIQRVLIVWKNGGISSKTARKFILDVLEPSDAEIKLCKLLGKKPLSAVEKVERALKQTI
jgi:hypothetical protein